MPGRGAGLLAAAVLVACAEQAPQPQPSGSGSGGEGAAGLFCRDPEVDLGAVWEGTVLEHEFVVEVRGEEPIELAAVRPDCGCTVPHLELRAPGASEPQPQVIGPEGALLPPGSELRVGVRYDTHGKGGSEPRTVTLYGGAQGSLPLRLHADVRPWLVADPSRFALPPLGVDEETEVRFHVESTDGTPFSLEPTGLALPPQITLEARPRAPGPDGRSASWEVVATLGPGLPEGHRAWPLELVADVVPQAPPGAAKAEAVREDAARFTVAPLVTVEVVGPLSLSPAQLSFGGVRAGETVARTARLVVHDPGFSPDEPQVRFEPARPEDEPLARTARVSVRALEPSGVAASARDADGEAAAGRTGRELFEIQLLLEGLPDEIHASFLGRLVVETGHPTHPRVEAPVLGFRRGPPPAAVAVEGGAD